MLITATQPNTRPVSLKLQALQHRLGTDPDSAEPLTGSRLLETLIPIDPTTVAGLRDRSHNCTSRRCGRSLFGEPLLDVPFGGTLGSGRYGA